MKKPLGFTLIELMVVIAIVAILATLAAPSFKQIIQTNAMSGAVNTFLADMRYARSEATRRGGNVVLCRSDAPEIASPVCGSGTGPGSKGWVSGWIVFHDLNPNDGARVESDTLLRVQSPITNLGSISETTPVNTFRFTATGRMNLSSATQLQFGGPNFTTEVQRVVCVNLSGRARIAGDGSKSCTADDTY